MTTETQSLSEEQQTLFDHVADVIKGVLYISFMEDLDDYGIETIEQFEDAFAGQYDGYGSQSPEAQFTEELITDCGYIGNDLPHLLVIILIIKKSGIVNFAMITVLLNLMDLHISSQGIFNAF